MTHVVSIKSNYKNGICFVFNFIVIHSNCCRMGTLRLAAIVNAKKELMASFLRLFSSGLHQGKHYSVATWAARSIQPSLLFQRSVRKRFSTLPQLLLLFIFLLIKFIYLFYIQTAASPFSTFPVFLPPSLCHH